MHYFDNAATTYPKPNEVYEFMDTFYRTYGVNVSRGVYKEASIAASLVRETRDLLLKLLHCNADKEVVFTPSATIAMNTILRGLPWKDGQTVYVTHFEHNAVIRTLSYIKTLYNINIKYLTPDTKTLKYDFDVIQADFQSGCPNYLVLNHASNSFGNITPIQEIITLAKKYNTISIVDMAQTAGLIDTNIMANLVDYTVFAGHKTLYAPLGVAGFVIDKNSSLPAFVYGGTGIDSGNTAMPLGIPERFEAGSFNILSIAGLNASLKWIENTGIKNIKTKEDQIKKDLIDLLKSYSNIKIIGHTYETDSVGIVSVIFDGYSSDNIGQILSEHGIAVRTGLHCSPEAHIFFETIPAGTVRFSVGYFTNRQDLAKLKIILDIIEESS